MKLYFNLKREIFVENDQTPKILIFIGVNGSGKTTTIGKIESQIRDENKILIAACDTFRAAAIDQLKVGQIKAKVIFFRKYQSRSCQCCFSSY